MKRPAAMSRCHSCSGGDKLLEKCDDGRKRFQMLRFNGSMRKGPQMNYRRDLWNEHPLLAGIAVIGVIIILAYIAVVIGYWWGNFPPKRPSTVVSDAVWTWGPGHKHGHWILCSVKETGSNAQCKIWDDSGNLDYEGDFRANRKSVLYPTKRLDIETRMTGPLSASIRNTAVPIIYLTDHKILIPVEAYSRPIKRRTDSESRRLMQSMLFQRRLTAIQKLRVMRQTPKICLI